MRTITVVLVAVFLVRMAAIAAAQNVVTYYPAAAPVATYYAPSVPVATYYAPAPTYRAAAPVATYYAPVVTTRYYAPRIIVRPKVYVRGQPIRNVLRAITP